MSRILITTDAWHPQVSGVVRTLESTVRVLRDWGHHVEVIEPSEYFRVAVPFYPEIPLSMPRPGRVYQRIHRFNPDHIHISTEGPLGVLVRQFCRKLRWRFSTSYHTRFPEYLQRLAMVPERMTYGYMRWFHRASSAMMVATPSLQQDLIAHGFRVPMRRWVRGVDLSLFCPRPNRDHPYPRPVMLYVGRVSHEKGIEDFLRIDRPGTKVIVGDGPARKELECRYPHAVFLGYRQGQSLGEIYSLADVFVFPSRTDTFGVVLIEALASGLPVAAYPVTGPVDIIRDSRHGALDHDLAQAVDRALSMGDPIACANEGKSYTWDNCTRQFLNHLVTRTDS